MASARCGVSGRLNEVRGAVKGDGGGVTSGWRLVPRICSATPTVRCTALAARTGVWASETAA